MIPAISVVVYGAFRVSSCWTEWAGPVQQTNPVWSGATFGSEIFFGNSQQKYLRCRLGEKPWYQWSYAVYTYGRFHSMVELPCNIVETELLNSKNLDLDQCKAISVSSESNRSNALFYLKINLFKKFRGWRLVIAVVQTI